MEKNFRRRFADCDLPFIGQSLIVVQKMNVMRRNDDAMKN
jgi:hypothetical protein